MGDTNSRPAYVDVAEVCRDWGCSRSKGYAIIRTDEVRKSPLINHERQNQSYLLRRSLYEEIGMERAIKKALVLTRAEDTYIAICIVVKESIA